MTFSKPSNRSKRRERSGGSGHSCTLVFLRGFSRIRRLGLIDQAGKFGNASGVFLPSAPSAESAVKGSRHSEMPSAVTFASWSAANGRGYIGTASSVSIRDCPSRSGSGKPSVAGSVFVPLVGFVAAS